GGFGGLRAAARGAEDAEPSTDLPFSPTNIGPGPDARGLTEAAHLPEAPPAAAVPDLIASGAPGRPPGDAGADPVDCMVFAAPSVQFGVNVPRGAAPGNRVGKVQVYWEGVPIGHVRFKFEVTAAAAPRPPDPVPLGDDARRYNLAFISYASKDRDEVLKRVQM